MKSTHPAARKYLRAVSRLLDAPKEERERLLTRLSQAVAAYVEENPGAGVKELSDALGAPEICAVELLAECDPDRLAALRERKRRRNVALIAILAAALVILAAVSSYLLLRGFDGPWITVRDHGLVTEKPPVEWTE